MWGGVGWLWSDTVAWWCAVSLVVCGWLGEDLISGWCCVYGVGDGAAVGGTAGVEGEVMQVGDYVNRRYLSGRWSARGYRIAEIFGGGESWGNAVLYDPDTRSLVGWGWDDVRPAINQNPEFRAVRV